VPRRRAKANAAQDVADRHRGYIVAELEELATDALVAPAGVVVCELDDQLFHLGWEGRPTPALAPPSRRTSCDEITVPPEQRLGPDGE
jgi:hypothetical protein